MSVEWSGYQAFDPGVDRPLHEVTKREARAAFDLLMSAKADRIVELHGLLAVPGRRDHRAESQLAVVMVDKGARDISFQRHVIMGFTGVANPKYTVDIDLSLATYGHRIIAREGVDREAFVAWVQAAVAKA